MNESIRPTHAPPPRFTVPAPTGIEPYRLMFPMGWAYALLGAGVWPLHALGFIPYPAQVHLSVMMQGFEQCFVLGFLLTAMPAFTHGPRCNPWELLGAVTAMTLFGIAALTGHVATADVAFLSTLALLWTAGLRRVVGNARKPPEEFLFVGFGLALGAVGSALLLASALGAPISLPIRFAERLLSLGMVLSLVMGVGSLLVPTFAGMRNPLVIPGIASPHEREGRRTLYVGVMGCMALAFIAELMGHPRLGMLIRGLAVATMGLWVWKLTRLPRRDAPGFALWGSGWMIMAGVWAAALWPSHATAGLHVAFIGGFGVLTLGIGTRVIVAHGKHPLEAERRALDAWVLALLVAALAFRVRAELFPDRAVHALAGSALFWLMAWCLWGLRVSRLVLRGAAQPPA